MIKCNLICIGKLKEQYWRNACSEYEKRLRPFCHFTIKEIPESRLPDHPNASQIQLALESESKRILETARGSFLVALCIEGDLVSPEQVADFIKVSALRGISEINFVIGSSYGLSDQLKAKADLRISMSKMTFPHQLARVMLCEQIYRSFQINHNGKYHK